MFITYGVTWWEGATLGKTLCRCLGRISRSEISLPLNRSTQPLGFSPWDRLVSLTAFLKPLPVPYQIDSHLPHLDKFCNRSKVFCNRLKLYRKWYSTCRRLIIFLSLNFRGKKHFLNLNSIQKRFKNNSL